MKVFVCLLLLCPALLVVADIIVCKGNTESQNCNNNIADYILINNNYTW